MLLERFYNDLLAQSSYLLACQERKLAIVVDPNRDLDCYLNAAAHAKLTIAYVAETHIHADFVSGARELAARSGARLLLSGEGGRDWQYRYAKQDHARIIRHGDSIELGRVRIDVRHTPGHTPEHVCFLITDRTTSERPVGMFSGDFVFVSDVGRPDLLERATNARGSMDALARALFRSLRATADLPDYVQLWPGHGAGSACGKSLGAMPSTTLGYERLANWAFQIDDEARFVREVLADQPEPPKYFGTMKSLNRDGPPPSPSLAMEALPELDLAAFERSVRETDGGRASVIDVRSTADFAAGHIPNTLNFPVGSSFATWAGSLLPYDRDIIILADDPRRVAKARHGLMLIGLDRVSAWAGAPLREEWERANGELSRVRLLDVAGVASSNHRRVLDVRGASEWKEGHVPGAEHAFLGDLVALTATVPRDVPIAVYCQGGTRSAIAASLLEAHGFTDVVNMSGGVTAWEAAGLPLEKPASS